MKLIKMIHLCFVAFLVKIHIVVTENIIGCQDMFVLLGTNRSSAKVLDVAKGVLVHLHCRFCTDEENYDAKSWHYKLKGVKIPSKELITNEKVYITSDHILTIKNFTEMDSGIYSCKSRYQDDQIIFTYVLEEVFEETVTPFNGKLEEWDRYKEIYFNPVNKEFTNPTKKPFVQFKKGFNFSFRLKTIWDSWGSCEPCTKSVSEGLRKRIGKCRLHVVSNIKKLPEIDVLTSISQYYTLEAYDVPCRSVKLYEFLPTISQIVRNIPDFLATASCAPDKNIVLAHVKERDYNFSTKLIVDGGHCTLICPSATLESKVEWFKEGYSLNCSFKNNMGNNNEPDMTIDSYNTLYILHAGRHNEGIFSCSVDGIKVQQWEIKVLPKSKLLNDDFFRYSGYLAFVLSLAMTCYCAGICVAWHGKKKFADPLNLNNRKNENCYYETLELEN